MRIRPALEEAFVEGLLQRIIGSRRGCRPAGASDRLLDAPYALAHAAEEGGKEAGLRATSLRRHEIRECVWLRCRNKISESVRGCCWRSLRGDQIRKGVAAASRWRRCRRW